MTGETLKLRVKSCILTINGGSSSIKFAVFRVEPSLQRLLEGKIERIGSSEAVLVVKVSNHEFSRPVTAPDHTAAVSILTEWIEESAGQATMIGIGHRVVHGGTHYSDPQLITPDMITALHQLEPFDPEHLPEEIQLTEAFHNRFPDLPQV